LTIIESPSVSLETNLPGLGCKLPAKACNRSRTRPGVTTWNGQKITLNGQIESIRLQEKFARRSERPKPLAIEPERLGPNIVTGEIDMLPAERRQERRRSLGTSSLCARRVTTVLWNTVYMERAIQARRVVGSPDPTLSSKLICVDEHPLPSASISPKNDLLDGRNAAMAPRAANVSARSRSHSCPSNGRFRTSSKMTDWQVAKRPFYGPRAYAGGISDANSDGRRPPIPIEAGHCQPAL